MNDLEEELNDFEDEYKEIRELLGNIQFRDLTKNFMKYIKSYLTPEDYNKIRENKKSRGKIISQRIAIKFPNVDKKIMSCSKINRNFLWIQK